MAASFEANAIQIAEKNQFFFRTAEIITGIDETQPITIPAVLADEQRKTPCGALPTPSWRRNRDSGAAIDVQLFVNGPLRLPPDWRITYPCKSNIEYSICKDDSEMGAAASSRTEDDAAGVPDASCCSAPRPSTCCGNRPAAAIERKPRRAHRLRGNGPVERVGNGGRESREQTLGAGRLPRQLSGASWEGFVIENLLGVAPPRAMASFYRTAAGAEIDLVLELPGKGRWAIEIKRSLSARPEKGFYIASEDIQTTRGFVVRAGDDAYPVSEGVEAVSLRALAERLAGWERGK